MYGFSVFSAFQRAISSCHLYPPDMDNNACDCISDLHIIVIAVAAVIVIALILLIPCFIILYYKKEKTEIKVNKERLENRKNSQTQELNDKIMALLTKLLDNMYSQVDRVPADLMGLFTDKLKPLHHID